MADDADTAAGQLSTLTDSGGIALADDEPTADTAPDDTPAPTRRGGVKRAVLAGVVVIVALGALAAWWTTQAYRAGEVAAQHALFLSVGRQGALNLTTIRAAEVDADVQRILDSSAGAFHADFQKHSDAFKAVVKQTQASSEGTVTEAGVESATDDAAQIVVAVAVKTTTPGQPAEQQPRLWRMRLTVQRVDGDAKVSDVAFVP